SQLAVGERQGGFDRTSGHRPHLFRVRRARTTPLESFDGQESLVHGHRHQLDTACPFEHPLEHTDPLINRAAAETVLDNILAHYGPLSVADLDATRLDREHVLS